MPDAYKTHNQAGGIQKIQKRNKRDNSNVFENQLNESSDDMNHREETLYLNASLKKKKDEAGVELQEECLKKKKDPLLVNDEDAKPTETPRAAG